MFLRSSKNDKHYHVILTPDPRKNQGKPITPEVITVGETKDHTHNVEYNEETGSWFLLPQNDHTHEANVNDVYQNAKLRKEDTRDLIATYEARFRRAIGYEKKSIDKADRAYKYINYDQWEKGTKEQLNNEGRPALQFDQIGTNTDKIIGYFLQDIPDVALYPVENGDEVMTDILTTVLKNIFRNSGFEELSEGVFSDIFVAGKGVFNLSMDFQRDIGGDITVDQGEYNHVIFGPHMKKNAEDCEDIFKIRILSEDQLKMEFPEKAEEVIKKNFFRSSGDSRSLGLDGIEYDMWLKTPGHQWDPPAAQPVPTAKASDDVAHLRTYVVVEWYRKSYFKEYIVRGPDGIEAPVRFRPGDASQLKRMETPMVDRISYVFEKVVMCNSVEMERFDTGFDFAPCSVAYGKKTKKGYLGKVFGAIDQQDEINKRTSQTSDIVNKMAAYNYFFTGESFGSPEEEQAFMNNSAKPGSAFKISDMENKPEMSDGVRVPVEALQLEENAKNRMDSYFGGVLDISQGAKVGSRGLLLQQRMALMVNEIYFKHYENAFIDLCKKIIHFVQRFYPPQKILRIIRSEPRDEREMAYQQMEDAKILELLSKKDFVYYDTAVGVTKSSPTFKEAQFELATELMKQGTGFPMDHYIELSSFPNKQKIKDSIAAQSEAQAEQAMQTEKMEVIKSMPDEFKMVAAPQLLQQYDLLPPSQQLPQQSPLETDALGAPLQ